jgi:hypothetical protein
LPSFGGFLCALPNWEFIEETKMSDVKTLDPNIARGSLYLDNQFASVAPARAVDAKSGVQVNDFLIARGELDKRTVNSQPQKVALAQRTEQMRPYVPGPAEALGSQIKNSLADILDWDIGSKNALKDYAQMVNSTSGSSFDDSSSDEDSEENDQFGLRELTKTITKMNRMQQGQILMMLELLDKKSAADMIVKTFKGANSSFNKLISG